MPKQPIRRPTFLPKTAASAMAQPPPAQTVPTNRLAEATRPGFDTYALPASNATDTQSLDSAPGLNAETAQISDSADYSNLDPRHLQQVKDHAARLGIQIDAGIGCICPLSKSWKPGAGSPEQMATEGLKVAKAVGARSMRCVMGGMEDRRGDRPIEEYMDATIKVFRAVKSQALDLGIRIALENHAGDMQAREVRTIIEESGKEFVGACLDTGNPMWVMENPQVTLEILGPYTVTTHVRDS